MKKTAKKTAPKKTTSRKAAADDPTPQPMDPSVPEQASPGTHRNRRRNCYALDTLMGEVLELFPETPVQTSNIHAGYNTVHDVQFDTSKFTVREDKLFRTLLSLIEGDARVEWVYFDEQYVLVSIRQSFRTQDSRESFGLADALMVLDEQMGFEGLDQTEESW